jgi:pimeloyl-ACP methyl ester carboxylesterase
VPVTPRPARRFVDLSHGQLHYWECTPAEVADAPPLVLLHASPLSARSLVPLAVALASRRRVLALDLPGNGDSEALGTPTPAVGDFVTALAEAVDTLAPGQFDLYGNHTGASMALGLAVRRPGRIRRLVLEGVAIFDDERRASLLAHGAAGVAPDRQGCHALWTWQFVRDSYLFWPWFEPTAENRRALGLPDADVLNERFVEVIKALGTYHQSHNAAIAHHHEDDLRALNDLPTLLLATPGDVLRRATEAAAALVPSGRFVELHGGVPGDRGPVLDGWLRRSAT